MAFKHKLKLFVRSAWARTLFHSGAHVLVDRLMPRRLTILAGHCVTAPSNARLPRDMKVEGAKLERILGWLARRYEIVTVAGGLEKLGKPGKRSLAALSMDDGYKDNRTHLLPLLQKLGASATIYLETRPLDERVPNWSHKFFWILDRMEPESFIHRFTELSRDRSSGILLNQLVPHSEATSYNIKRLLKYEVPPDERRRAIDAMFAELEGDERALADELYMTWEDARALQAAGVELGGHTVNHEILARLGAEGAMREITGCKRAIAGALGREPVSFAYPFGRRWDFDDASAAAVRQAGFASATTTHAGVNAPGSDPYRLKRLMIDEDAKLHLLACEACGGFELLRRFGLDLSE